IPLVGTSKSGRAEKFDLGALNAHRGKTVDQLIQESIEGYLDRESFGSCADVDKVLRQMGLDTTPFKSFYADLDRMMQRRHRIVHEADLLSPQDSAISLRANMAETLLVPLITEQGGKDIQHEEYEDILSGAVGRSQRGRVKRGRTRRDRRRSRGR